MSTEKESRGGRPVRGEYRVLSMPRLVWVLAACRVFAAATSFLVVFLTLYLTGPRGLPVGTAGLVSGLFGAGLLLGYLTGGRFGDRFGHRLVLLAGSTVAGVLLVVVPWLPLLPLVVALPTIAYATATAATSEGALVALAVRGRDRRTALAIGRSAFNAGLVVGPPIGALLIQHSFTTLFVVQGVATLVVRGVAGPLLPKLEPRREEATSQRGLWRSVRADHGLLVLLFAVILADLVYRQVFTMLPIYLHDQGQPIALYTALVATGAGLMFAFEVPIAVALRGRSPHTLVALGYALIGVGVGLFGFRGDSIVLTSGAAMLVVTAGEILYKPTAAALALDASPEHLIGQYQGLYAGAATSGALLAGPIGASVYSVAPDLLWPLTAATGVVAAGLVVVARSLERAAPTNRS